MAGILLNRDQKRIAKKQAHLLKAQFIALLKINHLAHDEEVVFKRLDLGPLRRVQHILHRQRMQAETLGHPLQQRHIAQSLDVDPVHFRGIIFGYERVPVGEFLVEQRVGVILNQPHFRRPRRARRGTQGSRRRS